MMVGFLKIITVLLVDYALLCSLMGWKAAFIICSLMLLYGWLGEYLALARDSAIPMEKLRDPERTRLANAREDIIEDVKRVSGTDISALRLSLLPADEPNARAYGVRNVAVTRALLASCDDATLCAVLGHEISHVLQADPVFHRLVFANVTLVLAALTLGSFACVSVLWIIFILLCTVGACRGLGGLLLFRGIGKGIRGGFTAAQHLLLFIYRSVMGLIGRSCEYRADSYNCQLGYALQLCYYLTRFARDEAFRQKSLREIVYASHPAPSERILRIEQYRTGS